MVEYKDYIGTIGDDDEISVCEESTNSEDEVNILNIYIEFKTLYKICQYINII